MPYDQQKLVSGLFVNHPGELLRRDILQKKSASLIGTTCEANINTRVCMSASDDAPIEKCCMLYAKGFSSGTQVICMITLDTMP